jgi:hypothetical protein
LLVWTAADSILYSAFDLALFEVEEPVEREIVAVTLTGGILSALGIRVYRWMRNRRGRWISENGAA